MKSIRSALLAVGISTLVFSSSQAQETATIAPMDPWQAILQTVAATTPFPATASPVAGNFYTFQNAGSQPPLPGNFMNLPF